MSDLDLTEAVNAAARSLYDQSYREIHGVAWEDAPGQVRHACGELVLPLVSAAVPSIAAQVRAEALCDAATALLATDVHEDLCSYGPPGTCDCALGEHYRWLMARAASLAPIEEAAPQLMGAHPFGKCICVRCGPPWRQPGQPRRPLESWMALCLRCGDKRCPGAVDHAKPCRETS